MTELDEILLNSMPNSWTKQAYVRLIDWYYINFQMSVNIFERMDISGSIY